MNFNALDEPIIRGMFRALIKKRDDQTLNYLMQYPRCRHIYINMIGGGATINSIYHLYPLSIDALPHVIQVLMNSHGMKLIKQVSQRGFNSPFDTDHPSRFEHCVGAYLIVAKDGVNGTIDEQVMALLHDAPHIALSHIVDNLPLGHKAGESVHEVYAKKIISQTDIPDIVNRELGSTVYQLFDRDERGEFSLLERPSPELCADRCDYTLRDGLSYGMISSEQVRQCFDSIISVNFMNSRRLCMTNIEMAQLIGNLSISVCDEVYNSAYGVGMYYTIRNLLIPMLSDGILTLELLLGPTYRTDVLLWECITKYYHHIGKIQVLQDYERTRNQEKMKFLLVPEGTKIDTNTSKLLKSGLKLKPRYIDPLFMFNDVPTKLSSIDQQFSHRVTDFKRRHELIYDLIRVEM